MFKTIFSKSKYSEDEKRVISIPVNLIKPNPYQPRKIFDKSSMEELCESIRTYGLIQPITIRKMPNSSFELVAGERRLRASKMIGMKEIPAIIIDITDADSAVLAIVENSHRDQLHFFEEAEAYYNLLVKHNISQYDLASRIGKSQSCISNKIRLLKLSPIIRKIISDNCLSERHAREFLKVEDESLQFQILQIVCEKKLNVSKTEELIDKVLSRASSKNTSKRKIVGVCKDLRIFVNTLNEAIKLMKQSGIKTLASQKDSGEYLEFNIKIHKNS